MEWVRTSKVVEKVTRLLNLEDFVEDMDNSPFDEEVDIASAIECEKDNVCVGVSSET